MKRTFLERFEDFNLDETYPPERVEIAREQNHRIENATREYLEKVREILQVKTEITQDLLDNVMLVAHTGLITPNRLKGKRLSFQNPLNDMYR